MSRADNRIKQGTCLFSAGYTVRKNQGKVKTLAMVTVESVIVVFNRYAAILGNAFERPPPVETRT
jgi:hypothetical protein